MSLDAPFKINKISAGQRSISAGNMNTAFRAIETAMNTQFDPKYFKVMRTPSGVMITLLSIDTDEDESLIIFGMDYTSTTCTIYEGKWYYNGAWHTFTQNDIALSGSESYVYVALNRTSLGLTLKQSATEPTPTADEAVLVMAHFTASGTSYTLTKRWYKGGAYYAEAPIP